MIHISLTDEKLFGALDAEHYFNNWRDPKDVRCSIPIGNKSDAPVNQLLFDDQHQDSPECVWSKLRCGIVICGPTIGISSTILGELGRLPHQLPHRTGSSQIGS